MKTNFFYLQVKLPTAALAMVFGLNCLVAFAAEPFPNAQLSDFLQIWRLQPETSSATCPKWLAGRSGNFSFDDERFPIPSLLLLTGNDISEVSPDDYTSLRYSVAFTTEALNASRSHSDFVNRYIRLGAQIQDGNTLEQIDHVGFKNEHLRFVLFKDYSLSYTHKNGRSVEKCSFVALHPESAGKKVIGARLVLNGLPVQKCSFEARTSPGYGSFNELCELGNRTGLEFQNLTPNAFEGFPGFVTVQIRRQMHHRVDPVVRYSVYAGCASWKDEDRSSVSLTVSPAQTTVLELNQLIGQPTVELIYE